MRADERILGRSEFVERVLKEADENWERKSSMRQRGIDLPQLVERVAGYFSLEIEDLKSGSKVSSIAKARAVLCYVGARQLWANRHFPCEGARCESVGSEQGNSTWAEVFGTREYRGNTVGKSINQERPLMFLMFMVLQ